jgi:hypothetical protein
MRRGAAQAILIPPGVAELRVVPANHAPVQRMFELQSN